jgi:hypothetical protein
MPWLPPPKSVHTSNCGFCQVRHSGTAECTIAECPLFVRPCGPRPPGDFTIPAARCTAELSQGSQGLTP